MSMVPTRTAILEGAETWFADRGFSGARLVDITGQAGVTTGALYRYFSSKEALFTELFATFAEDGVARITRADGFEAACTGWLSCATAHEGTLRAAFELARPGTETSARLRAARDRFAAALTRHLPPGAYDHAIAGRVIVDVMAHYGLSSAAGWIPRRAVADVAAALGRLIDHGLYTDATTLPTRVAKDLADRAVTTRPPYEPFIRWAAAEGKDEPRYARGRRTWEAIRSAAITVLAERGLTDATALDVAKAAGVSSGTVYRYFVDKEDIFRSLQSSAEADIVRETHLPLEHGRLAIRGMLLAYFAVYRRHIALFRAWQELLQLRAEMAEAWIGMREQFIETAARAIRFGQRAGIADPQAEPGLIAELHSICYEAVAYSHLILGWDPDTTDESTADVVERLFIGGFIASS